MCFQGSSHIHTCASHVSFYRRTENLYLLSLCSCLFIPFTLSALVWFCYNLAKVESLHYKESTILIFFFLGPHLPHMEVPRRGVQWELKLPAYITATATQIQDASVTYTTAHGNARSLTPERGQGWNPHPHGCYSGSFLPKPQRKLQNFSFNRNHQNVFILAGLVSYAAVFSGGVHMQNARHTAHT